MPTIASRRTGTRESHSTEAQAPGAYSQYTFTVLPGRVAIFAGRPLTVAASTRELGRSGSTPATRTSTVQSAGSSAPDGTCRTVVSTSGSIDRDISFHPVASFTSWL